MHTRMQQSLYNCIVSCAVFSLLWQNSELSTFKKKKFLWDHRGLFWLSTLLVRCCLAYCGKERCSIHDEQEAKKEDRVPLSPSRVLPTNRSHLIELLTLSGSTIGWETSFQIWPFGGHMKHRSISSVFVWCWAIHTTCCPRVLPQAAILYASVQDHSWLTCLLSKVFPDHVAPTCLCT